MGAKKLVAIGDSFFYINDHREETGFRLSKGILSRVKDKLYFKVELINVGQNGWKTSDWVANMDNVPVGDIYLIMLGTNDWWSGLPMGGREDFLAKTIGTILGDLGFIIAKIKEIAPQAQIYLCNPVERSDFVYIHDYKNNAKGSYEPHCGQALEQIANAIFTYARAEGVVNINTHDKSGITCFNAVKFKRCCSGTSAIDLPYPNYTNSLFDPDNDAYPYPLEAIGTTYDGLHPSDEGSEAIARVIADAINSTYKE